MGVRDSGGRGFWSADAASLMCLTPLGGRGSVLDKHLNESVCRLVNQIHLSITVIEIHKACLFIDYCYRIVC